VVREEPPRRLGVPVGDAIQNIRNALAYLVYELSPAKYRCQGRTGFPIYDDECLFEVEGRKQIRGITGDELRLIERYQPYVAAHAEGGLVGSAIQAVGSSPVTQSLISRITPQVR
jgi:hypothetical protein